MMIGFPICRLVSNSLKKFQGGLPVNLLASG